MEERAWSWIRNAILEKKLNSVEELIKCFDQEIFENKCREYENELREGILAYRENDIQEAIKLYRNNLGSVFLDNGYNIIV